MCGRSPLLAERLKKLLGLCAASQRFAEHRMECGAWARILGAIAAEWEEEIYDRSCQCPLSRRMQKYFLTPDSCTLIPGDHVIVETAQGLEYAQCTMGNHPVDDRGGQDPCGPWSASPPRTTAHSLAHNRTREKEAFDICQRKILQHNLEMKLVEVECSFEGSKILFFFTADGRVDFRELVKDLASVFRARIELRQIGVRDEAKMLGGLGICGRPFCCTQFLDDFIPVSIKMAKTQSLSLNPTKISGTCGRLMCCLKYEQDAYEDAIRRLPKNESFVLTPDGTGNVSEVNVLKETVNVRPG